MIEVEGIVDNVGRRVPYPVEISTAVVALKTTPHPAKTWRRVDLEMKEEILNILR